ncbi:hypothetical protein BHYA_0013g00080 [Botrytis hyacinthi]|uniref:Uncharacterized protein n=1 Tax=Botrytis hyacinthi TaxID=278943 RepID=A0A4Z1GZM1_9HELO|nr:hypothetical protein BHYA_0013g00080 [Botrytis hyacinthi]
MCGWFSPKPRDISAQSSVTATSPHTTYQVDQTRWGKDTSTCFRDVDEWDAEYGVVSGQLEVLGSGELDGRILP